VPVCVVSGRKGVGLRGGGDTVQVVAGVDLEGVLVSVDFYLDAGEGAREGGDGELVPVEGPLRGAVEDVAVV